jgi:hypothetical protein
MHLIRSARQARRPTVDHERSLYWSSNSHWHVHPTSKTIRCDTFSNSRTPLNATVRDTRSRSTDHFERGHSVPSRSFSWVQMAAPRVEALVGKTSSDSTSTEHAIGSRYSPSDVEDRETELDVICSQLYQLLSVIQGIALHHTASKVYLGRRYPLEVRHHDRCSPVC